MSKNEEERSFVKVVGSGGGNPFLVTRVLSDLKKENYGNLGERPTVLFENGHESVEKSLWCYEQNTLPVIGEPSNIPATLFLIERYQSDSFVGDAAALKSLFAAEKNPLPHGERFNICGIKFKLGELTALVPAEKLTLVLDLPEVGALAHSCPEGLVRGEVIFHPLKDEITEYAEEHESVCGCDSRSFKLRD